MFLLFSRQLLPFPGTTSKVHIPAFEIPTSHHIGGQDLPNHLWFRAGKNHRETMGCPFFVSSKYIWKNKNLIFLASKLRHLNANNWFLTVFDVLDQLIPTVHPEHLGNQFRTTEIKMFISIHIYLGFISVCHGMSWVLQPEECGSMHLGRANRPSMPRLKANTNPTMAPSCPNYLWILLVHGD